MTLSDVCPRDIWLAYVAFADHPDVGKVRPVVILDNLGTASVISAKVTTSTGFKDSRYLEIPDWKACGLRRQSYVQLSPLLEIRRDKLLHDEPLGRLPNHFFERLLYALRELPPHDE